MIVRFATTAAFLVVVVVVVVVVASAAVCLSLFSWVCRYYLKISNNFLHFSVYRLTIGSVCNCGCRLHQINGITKFAKVCLRENTLSAYIQINT